MKNILFSFNIKAQRSRKLLIFTQELPMSMTTQPSTESSSKYCWELSRDGNKYSFGKKSKSDSNIQRVNIYIFNRIGNQRLEVHARTNNSDTYFKIVEIAQKYFSDTSRFYFDSTYASFPKDKDGLCTFEAAKKIHSTWEGGLIEQAYLESSLAYRREFTTHEDLSEQLKDALNVLHCVDETVKEIANYFKVMVFVK